MRIRCLNLVLLAALLVSVPLFSAAAAPAPAESIAAALQAPVSAAPVTAASQSPEANPQGAPQQDTSREAALAKLHPTLREIVQTASAPLKSGDNELATATAEPILIEVMAKPGADLSAYFQDGKMIARPVLGKGENALQTFFGFAMPNVLLKIAELDVVQTILPITLEKNGYPDDYPADDTAKTPTLKDQDAVRAKLQALSASAPDWADAKAFGDGRTLPQPKADLVLAADPHNVQAAWDQGFTGEGVTVAVVDDGIDTAHPDLMGTQKLYSSTLNSQYNGWPMVFSPFSMFLYALQEAYDLPYISYGYPSAHYVDTSETPTLTPASATTSTFVFTPLLDFGVPGYEHTYTIDNTMTKSGVVHVGTHPDVDLRDFLWVEKVAVLVCDPHTAGVYDTVYVDLNDDYDFTDEKPLTRADMSDPTTYNNMIAYRDLNADGLADISGGSLYFIADGVNVIPASDWLYGAQPGFMLPGNGDLVAFSGGSATTIATAPSAPRPSPPGAWSTPRCPSSRKAPWSGP